MTTMTSLSAVFLEAQSECDAIIRGGGDAKRLATISFLACDILLALCEESMTHAEDVVEAMSRVFGTLAKEADRIGGKDGARLSRAHLACEAASLDLAYLIKRIASDGGTQ